MDHMAERQPTSKSIGGEPKGGWASLFQATTDAVFLLNPRRRLRYVNPAWESITRTPATTLLHEYCWPRKLKKDLPAGLRMILQAMAPPPEVMAGGAGRIVQVRRAAPPGRLGPPWWDITFLPLREGDKLAGIAGIIHVVASTRLPTESHIKGMSATLADLRESAVRGWAWSLFDWEHDASQMLLARARLSATHTAPLWLVGEAGTGKESLARVIHHNGTQREKGFVVVDGAGLQPYLIRSLLFGHNGLAETGRIGTLYLKSPEAIPADLRAEIVDWHSLAPRPPRVVVGLRPEATLDPEFRKAFGIVELRLPALREVREALPGLLILSTQRETTTAFQSAVAAWSWPGNLREWRSAIALAEAQTPATLDVDHLPEAIRRGAVDARARQPVRGKRPSPSLDETLEQVERRLIELAMKQSRGDQTAAAERLGMHRSRLLRRLQALGIGETK
jgi:DNA-binding protein Fis